MTGGQSKFEFISNNNDQSKEEADMQSELSNKEFNLSKIIANTKDLSAHEEKLKDMQDRSSIEPIWRKLH